MPVPTSVEGIMLNRRWERTAAPAVLVLVGALCARAAINFANVAPGGMDAGYYPIQARSLIETGSLLYRDVPLYHHAAAGLARGLVPLGWSLDSAVLAASKILDTIVPLLLGVVMLAMGRGFLQRPDTGICSARGRAVILAAPVALAVLSAPAIRMVSDFQKQAAAMALLAASVCVCRRALATGGQRALTAWAGVAVLLALTGLTHAGTFASAVLTLGCVVGVYALVFARISPAKLAALGVVGAGVAAGLYAGVYVADQGKALGLVRGLSKITRFTAATGPGGGGRGPGGGFGALGLALAVISHAVGVWAVAVARRAKDAPASDRAVGVGCAIAAMALASPLLAPDYFMRLTLMAPAPLAVALAFVFAQRSRAGGSAWPAIVALAASVVSAAVPLSFLMRPMVSEAGIAELAAMREVVNETPGTVVVARHGLEFWAAYFLHTSVRTAPAKPAELAKFERVLVLDEIDGPTRHMGPGGPGGRGPRSGGPPEFGASGHPGFGSIGTGPPERVGPPLIRGAIYTLVRREPHELP